MVIALDDIPVGCEPATNGLEDFSSHKPDFHQLISWLISARIRRQPIECCSSPLTSDTLLQHSSRRPRPAIASVGTIMATSICNTSRTSLRQPQIICYFHSAEADCDAKPSNQSLEPTAGRCTKRLKDEL